MELEYKIIYSEFFINKAGVDVIKNGGDPFEDNSEHKGIYQTIQNAKKFEMEVFSGFDDALSVLKKDFPNRIAWIKDEQYKCSLCWIEEDDGYNGGEMVEFINEYNIYDKPEMTKEDILKQIVSVKENALSFIEPNPFEADDVWRKDIVAVDEVIKLLKNKNIKIGVNQEKIEPEEDTVQVICYGKTYTYNSREEAIKDYMENIAFSEGAERDRYTNILLELHSGKKVCTDGDEVNGIANYMDYKEKKGKTK